MASVSVYRSRDNRGRYVGTFKAAWRDGSGQQVRWTTGAYDEAEARRLGEAERARRLGSLSAGTGDVRAAPAVAPSFQVSDGATGPAPPRRLTAAVAKAIAVNSAPEAPAGPVRAEVDQSSAVFKVAAKAAAHGCEALLKKAIRAAGREPADADDDELQLIQEGFAELFRGWFGKTELGPWGKIAAGCTIAGMGMFNAGKPLPKPEPENQDSAREVS